VRSRIALALMPAERIADPSVRGSPMQAFVALAMLTTVLVTGVIGVSLLLVARRTRELPEFLFGVGSALDRLDPLHRHFVGCFHVVLILPTHKIQGVGSRARSFRDMIRGQRICSRSAGCRFVRDRSANRQG
jgi:hypothetical protein